MRRSTRAKRHVPTVDSEDEDEPITKFSKKTKSPKMSKKKPVKPDASSSSESDIENYLQKADEIDLKSSFFDIPKKEENVPFEKLEKDIFAGVTRLSDSSDSEEEAENDKTPLNEEKEPIRMETEEITSSSTFKQMEDFTKKIEEAKKFVEKYEAKKKSEENNLDVSNLLAVGETCMKANGEALKLEDLHSSDFESCDSDNDWEEVKGVEGKDEINAVPKEGLQITLDMPNTVRKKKGVDLVAALKRRLNRIRKENQVLVHKVHLLCWIAHGNYINSAINKPENLSLALSLLPSEQCYPSDRIDLSYLEQLVKWYKNTMKYIDKVAPKNFNKAFEMHIGKREGNLKTLNYIFIAILRALNVQCRLVLSFQVEPLRPPMSELHSLSTKEKDEDKPSTSKSNQKITAVKVKKEIKSEKKVSEQSKKEVKDITKNKKADSKTKTSSKSTKSENENKTKLTNKKENTSLKDKVNKTSQKSTEKVKTENQTSLKEKINKNLKKSTKAANSDSLIKIQVDYKKEQKPKIGKKSNSKTVKEKQKNPNKIQQVDGPGEDSDNESGFKGFPLETFKVGDSCTKCSSPKLFVKLKNETFRGFSPFQNKSDKTKELKILINRLQKSLYPKDNIKSKGKQTTIKQSKERNNNTSKNKELFIKLERTSLKPTVKKSLAKQINVAKKDKNKIKRIIKIKWPSKKTIPPKIIQVDGEINVESEVDAPTDTSDLEPEEEDDNGAEFITNLIEEQIMDSIPQVDGDFNSSSSEESSDEEVIMQVDGGNDKKQTKSKKPNLSKLKENPVEKPCSSKDHQKRTRKSIPSYVENDSEEEFSNRSPFTKKNVNSPKVNLKKLSQSPSPLADVRNDIIALVKGRINEQKDIDRKKMVKKVVKRQDSSDSDYAPEPIQKKHHSSDDEFVPKVKVKKRVQVKKNSSNKVLSDDSETGSSPTNKGSRKKKGVNIWCEVFLEAEEKWISVDVMHGQVHCVNEIFSRASHPVSYIVAWNNDNRLKDITSRYCTNFNTVTRRLRIDSKWWQESLKPFEGSKTVRDKEEDDELRMLQLEKPLPTVISEYKNHPLYALSRHLLKFEAIYPPDVEPIGYVRKEPVYPRSCVFTLHSRDIWLKSAKVVRLGEQPYKIVKARPKYDKLSNTVVTDKNLEIFGPWQVQDYEPPTAENGIVPRNAFGNVELFKSCMLPKKTVHLKLPGLNKIAKKMDIDCASAIVGFDFHGGWSHPVYDGFVVCEEYEDQLVAAWELEQEEIERKEEEKIEKRVYGNWKRLIKGLLIRERLKVKYDFGEPSGKGGAAKKKAKAPKFCTKRRRIVSDSESDTDGK